MKRKIAIVVDNRTNWTKAQTICEEVEANPDLELQLILTSTFENENKIITRYAVNRVPTHKDSMAGKSARIIVGLESIWSEVGRPDIVVALTDRFETLAVAQTAALMNIHIAHIQGGEVTGTIDESIRHTVTKLSHIHFVSNLDAKQRVIKLGEDPRYVIDVGCPSIDLLKRNEPNLHQIAETPFILVLMHPVTTEPGLNKLHMISVLDAVYNRPYKESHGSFIIVFSPNNDLGSDEIWDAIGDRRPDFRDLVWASKSPTDFHSLIKYCSVMVGNSSAGIREAGYFGIPVVDCGTRQQGRIRSRNVITVVDLTKPDGVRSTIEAQLEHGPYEPIQLFGNGTAGKQISDLLATMELPPIQKRIRF